MAEDRRATRASLSSAINAPVTMAWVEGTPPLSNTLFTRLTPATEGSSVQPRVASTCASPRQSGVGLAGNGSEYVAVWNEFTTAVNTTPLAYAAQVSATGQVRGVPRQIPHFGTPIWVGTHYLLLWLEAPQSAGTGRYAIRGTRVTYELEVVDPDGFVVMDSDTSLILAGAAFDGDRTLVIGASTQAAFVDSDGHVEAVPGFDVNASGYASSLAHGDSGFLLVREADAKPPSGTFGYQVEGVLLDAQGRPSPSGWFVISDVVRNTRRRPVVAYGQGSYLVVYQADPSGFGAVRPAATRVNSRGTLEDTTGILVAPNATSGYINQPSVVFDGTNFVVSWSALYRGYNQTQVTYVARVGPTGNALDPSGIVLPYPAQHEQVMGASSIATLGSGWTLVAYSREDVELGWTNRINVRALLDPNANGTRCFLDSDCSSHQCVAERCVADNGQAGAPSVGAAGASFVGNTSATSGIAGGPPAGGISTSITGAAGALSAGAIGTSIDGLAGTTGSTGGGVQGSSRRSRHSTDHASEDGLHELNGCVCGLPQRDAKAPSSVLLAVLLLGLWRRKYGRPMRDAEAKC